MVNKSWAHSLDILQAAAMHVRGSRPAGGPYKVIIDDFLRFKTNREARIPIRVVIDGNMAFDGEVPLEVWRKLVKGEKITTY